MPEFINSPWRFALFAVTLWALAMFTLMSVGLHRFNLGPDTAYNWMSGQNINHNKDWKRVVTLWDGTWYLSLAQRGYRFNPSGLSNVAFLPLYPLLLATLKPLLGSYALAGLVINFLALLIAAYGLQKLANTERLTPEKGREAVWYLLMYPTAVFFAAVYTEALFVCLAILTFYFSKTQRLWLAGLCGMLAALTRLPGLFLLAPFVYYAYHERAPLKHLIAGALIPAGTGIYLLAQKIYTGNALAFLTAQKNWGRHFFHFNPDHVYWKTGAGIVNSSSDIAFALLLIIGIWYIYKKLDLGYALFAFFVVFVPLATGSLMSIGRFGMVIFPLFLAIAKSDAKWLKQAYVVVALIALTLYTVQFVNGYWAG